VTGPVSLAGRKAVVIGGGIAGLAAAIVLGRRGAAVEVIERDPIDAEEACETAFVEAERPGTPQVRHSHVFLGRLRNLLHEDYPEILQALMDAGAREINGLERPPRPLRGMAIEPGDERLIILACRRTTFEWVLRRQAAALPNVRMRSGVRVGGLLGITGRRAVVSGVFVEVDGRTQPLYAHLVVDASGRRSLAPEWLAALGAPAVRERVEPSGIVYYTRFYRLREGASEPAPGDVPLAADLDWIKYSVFPGDSRTYSVTLAVPLTEPELKVLQHAEAFDTMVRMIPGLGEWIDPARCEAIEPRGRGVQAMGGLINRLRRFVAPAGPVATRFFALGDAAYCTNPLYGRGCAQAFLHAHFLGEALDEANGDATAAAYGLDQRARAHIEPYFHASVVADREAVRRAEGREPSQFLNRLRARFFRDGVGLALRYDPVVYRAFLRMMNMLETPEEAFGRAEVALRCLWYMARSESYRALDPPPSGPRREDAIRACRAAVKSAPLTTQASG